MREKKEEFGFCLLGFCRACWFRAGEKGGGTFGCLECWRDQGVRDLSSILTTEVGSFGKYL
jgi:hypothetical protein